MSSRARFESVVLTAAAFSLSTLAMGCAVGVAPSESSEGPATATPIVEVPITTTKVGPSFDEVVDRLSSNVMRGGWTRVDVGQHPTMKRLPVTNFAIAQTSKLSRMFAEVKSHHQGELRPVDDDSCRTTMAVSFFDDRGVTLAELETSDHCGRLVVVGGSTFALGGELSAAIGKIADEERVMADVLYGFDDWEGEPGAETPVLTERELSTVFSLDETIRVMWESDLPDVRPVGSFSIRRKDRSSVYFEILGHAGPGGYLARVQERTPEGASTGTGYVDYLIRKMAP